MIDEFFKNIVPWFLGFLLVAIVGGAIGYHIKNYINNRKHPEHEYRHCVRMYHWMYTHGHHKKYAKIFADGMKFKNCFELKLEKYEFEFKPFDISLKLKKYKINKRKKELENDFN